MKQRMEAMVARMIIQPLSEWIKNILTMDAVGFDEMVLAY